MPKHYRITPARFAAVIIIVLAVGFAGAYTILPKIAPPPPPKEIQIAGQRTVEMGIPAVDTNNNGVIGTLKTTIMPGTGDVLVNINDVLAQFDTQLSARTAAKAVADLTGTNFNDINVIYDIQVNASVIEGPSAGAAMATSLALAAENIPAPKTIMMTGTIEPDGSIGQVGAVLEKAAAAKASGITLFLVPQGQSTDTESRRTRTCTDVNGFQVCQIKYNPNTVNIGNKLNVTVQEIGTLEDAVNVYRQAASLNQLNVTI